MTLSSKRARQSGVDRTRVLGDCVHPNEPTEPTGYVAWHEWVEKYAETHDQGQCPDCGLWVIWTPKETTDAA